MAHDGFIQAHLRVDFLGLDFTPLAQEAALNAVAAKAGAHGAFAYVVTPNVAHVVGLDRDMAGRARNYADAWLTLNDSRVLEALAKLSRVKLPVATGADLTEALLTKVIHRDEKVCIVGGDAELVAAIAARYKLNNVAWRQPPMGLARNAEAIEQTAEFIAKTRARYTFICVGAPQQEMIARAVLRRGDAVGVGLCVGAALEFLSGRVRRAPKWMQRIRMEWAWRLASEPKRLWRRYLLEAPRIFPIWYYWLCAQFKDQLAEELGGERASISARNAF